MRVVCSFFAAACLCAASPAWAQMGDVGAPALLALPDGGPAYYPRADYAARSTMPAAYTARPQSLTPTPADGYGPEVWHDNTPSPSDESSYLGGSPFNEPWDGSSCDDCSPCSAGRCSVWYGSLAGLYMGRDEPNEVWLSFLSSTPDSALLGTRDARSDFQAGFEATVGRKIGCNQSLEATYWTLDAAEDDHTIFNSVSGFNSALDFGTLTLDGVFVNDFYDNAWAHRVERRNEFHNVEINWQYHSNCCDPCGLQLSGLLGVRYFRFDEGLLFGTAGQNTNFGGDPTEEAYYDLDVENNLIGLQIGGRGEYFITPCLSLYAVPKLGVYDNYITHSARIYRGDEGFTALDVSTKRNDVAMLGQLDLGANYRWSDRVSAFAGYRVVGVSGVALSDEQFPQFIEDAGGARTVESASELILHGGFAGVEVRF